MVLFIEVAAEGVLVRVVHLVVAPRSVDGRDDLACLCNTHSYSPLVNSHLCTYSDYDYSLFRLILIVF